MRHDTRVHGTGWLPWLTLLIFLITSIGLSAFAQTMAPAATELPPAGIDAQQVLSQLSDEQLRGLVIAEFLARNGLTADLETPVSPDDAAAAGFLAQARLLGDQLTANLSALLAKWPQIGAAFAAIPERLAPSGGLIVALFWLVVSLIGGYVARHLFRRGGVQRQARLIQKHIGKPAFGTLTNIGDGLLFFAIDLMSVVVFACAALATLFVFVGHPDIRLFVSAYIGCAAVILLVRVIITQMFPLNWIDYRLVRIDDRTSYALHGVVVTLAVIWSFESATTEVLNRFGASAGVPDLISLLMATLWLLSALVGITVVYRRSAHLLPSAESATSLNAMMARRWMVILGAACVLFYLLFVGDGLLDSGAAGSAIAILNMMGVIFGSWAAYRIFVRYMHARALNDALRQAILRAVEVVLFALGLLVSLSIWGLSPSSLGASGPAGQWFVAVVDVTLTAMFGWAAWVLIRTLIDQRIAAETADDDDEEQSGDGEGGLGASRSATLLPLLRTFALTAIGLTCLFTVLSSLGANVAPLIAGAGVLGLAIGFGAQTLVKDIVSGVFFLVDDAFRRGEYIDIGSVKGTVERISVRSLQLRHHLGAIHTIPFGDIAALTNYSRDWVIMKLPLRLTFDTDPQHVKKIIKRIGAELQADELLGKGLIEPPKSQGVIQMEDSAMILRVKFMAVPGKQFAIRRELLHRIRAVFETEGIRFANREVTVRINEDATPGERAEAVGAAARRVIDAETEAAEAAKPA